MSEHDPLGELRMTDRTDVFACSRNPEHVDTYSGCLACDWLDAMKQIKELEAQLAALSSGSAPDKDTER